MTNRNLFETLTQYRLKIEKDGKSVVDVPSIFALPGLLMVPKLSLTGLIAAPLLGLKVHLENENGEAVNVEDTVRKAADAVKASASAITKTIKEEMDRAWEAASDGDPEENADMGTEENTESDTAEDVSNQKIVEELEAHEENDAPVIRVKSDDTSVT